MIGKNQSLVQNMQKFFNAKMVFAYKYSVYDYYCFLNESILLSLVAKRIEKNLNFTPRHFSAFLKNTNFMKNNNIEKIKNHPMVMQCGNKFIEQKVIR